MRDFPHAHCPRGRRRHAPSTVTVSGGLSNVVRQLFFLPQWTEIYMIYMYSVFCLSDSGYYLLLAGCDTSRYCIGVSDGDAVYASIS